jgi:hypothetical protein
MFMNIATPSRDFSYRVQESREGDFGEMQGRDLQQDFSELRRWVERLPPMLNRP